ncbi:UNVERIFIED_CONTAM: hypothetical protein LK11_19775 [Mumia flava]
MQTALAGEHAAVYAYGLLAGRLDAGTALQAQSAGAFASHRDRRDRLEQTLTADGQVPVPSEPAYDVGRTDRPRDVRRVARTIESRLAVTWGAVVAATDGPTRAAAVEALTESSAAILAWGGRPSALPGLGV